MFVHFVLDFPEIAYTFRDICTCIFYMFIAVDIIICYHSQKLGMANRVYLRPIYINGVDFVYYTRNIAQIVIVHVFVIFNKRLLALSHSEHVCNLIFQ